MKRKRKKHVLIMMTIGLLYFLGVAAIIYPMVGNIYSLTTSRAVISSYNDEVKEMDNHVIEDKFADAEKYNRELANGYFDEPLSRSLNMRDDIMCYLEVPSVEIYLPVYYGTSEHVLHKGCGWLEKTSLPINGASVHSVIAGHTGLPSAEMLTKLDQVKVGEQFYIRVFDRTLVYRVVHIEAVTPERTDLLQIEDGKDYVTLLTCTPYGINDKRLLVKGQYVGDAQPAEQSELSDSSDSSAAPQMPVSADEGLRKQISGMLGMILVITIGAVIVYIAACIWLGFMTRKQKQPAAQNNQQEKSGDEDVKTEK